MGENLNAREIHHFLRDYRTLTQGYGQPSCYDYGHVPRYVPSVTRSAYSQSDDARSECTTASTVTSQTYTTRSAAPSSIFSRRDDDQNSVGGSTAPSLLGDPQTTFVQQFHTANTIPQRPGQILWCEFSELLRCGATFPLDERAGWIQHHVLHLQNSFPHRLMCWFCDRNHAPFIAQGPADGYANFEDRMQHIWGHIFDDHRLSSKYMRPDFYTITHLHDNGSINDYMFNHAMSYTELPDRYRLPNSHSHSHSSSGPHAHQAAAPREKGQYHDLEKEKRDERRRQQQKEKQSGRKR